jgi:hypothetical protein
MGMLNKKPDNHPSSPGEEFVTKPLTRKQIVGVAVQIARDGSPELEKFADDYIAALEDYTQLDMIRKQYPHGNGLSEDQKNFVYAPLVRESVELTKSLKPDLENAVPSGGYGDIKYGEVDRRAIEAIIQRQFADSPSLSSLIDRMRNNEQILTGTTTVGDPVEIDIPGPVYPDPKHTAMPIKKVTKIER